VLATLYPQGAEIFWGLGITCAVLRYIMDAHWPSDVVGGVALGYAAGFLTLPYFLH
jgi:membrane-associated phospholipid phosphatase